MNTALWLLPIVAVVLLAVAVPKWRTARQTRRYDEDMRRTNECLSFLEKLAGTPEECMYDIIFMMFQTKRMPTYLQEGLRNYVDVCAILRYHREDDLKRRGIRH